MSSLSLLKYSGITDSLAVTAVSAAGSHSESIVPPVIITCIVWLLMSLNQLYHIVMNLGGFVFVVGLLHSFVEGGEVLAGIDGTAYEVAVGEVEFGFGDYSEQ